MNKSKRNLFKRQLFWKILGVFWLTTLLTVFANIYITKQIADIEQRYERIQTKLQDMAHDAVIVYESSGEQAVQQWYNSQYTRHQIRVVLFDKKGHPIGKPINKKQEPIAEFIPHIWRQKWSSLVKQPVLTSSGEKYILKVLPSPFIYHTTASFHDYKLYRLLVSFIIIALGSFWLSRSVVRPIKRLTEASEQMAEGDLSIRVKDKIGDRSDELGELANAFNHMAERTEALLSNQQQLLRDISHEIRTPLTRQKIAIELAKSDCADKSLLVKIEQQNTKLDELIDCLLTFSRLNNGSKTVPLETIESTPLIQSICEVSELEAHNKDIKIEQKIFAIKSFQGNLMLATRAIDNILGNALKYSPVHSIISVSSNVENGYLIIQIKDQGHGINEEHIPHVFEPFYRVDESRNSGTGGYGLGLAIVDQIMKQHKGRIELGSNLPNGLVVSLFFPLEFKQQ